MPFLEEDALYNSFHLDEPWDSDHNIACSNACPPSITILARHRAWLYRLSSSLSDKSLLRQTEPTKIQEITDGTSNTILALETSTEAAVPWTAPQDYEIDEDNPGLDLFTNAMTQMLFGDGSVQTLYEGVGSEVLNALYTRAGGEVVQVP
ncbi:MAG: hypothetical protein R3C56_38420 [Pirellulaceae bacterium]